MALKHIPSPDPSWNLHISVGCFINNPSKSELASQLHRLAEQGVTAVPPRYSWWIPWTLSACLRGQSPEDLHILANLIDSGAVGDIAEWKAAEHRWSSSGVTLADLKHSAASSLPFASDIAEVGFPYDESRSARLLPAYWNFDVARIMPAFNQLDGIPIQAEISERLLSLIASGNEYHGKNERDFASLRPLLTHVRPGSGIQIPALSVLFPDSIEAKWIDILESLASEAHWIHSQRRPAERLAQELWKAFVAAPHRTGILRLLAELSSTTPIPDIPLDYIDPSKMTDIRLRAAGITLLLTQRAAYSKSTELAAQAATLGGELSEFIGNAAKIFRERQVDTDFANNFLLTLIRNLPATDTTVIGQALDGLDSSVRRRRSQLDDPTVWQELKLPVIAFKDVA